MTRRFLLACLVVAAAAAAPALADNWPQWRGPKNDGHSAEMGLPTEWGPDKNVVWKLKMPGHGSSTPCIWGDKIFLTSMDGEAAFLFCIGTDGKEKWKRKMTANARGGYRGEGDDASASCSTDGKHVWAFVGTGRLACYDLDGNPAWEADVQRYGKFGIQFGIHWTPVLYQGRLYLQVMHRNAQLLVALDAATGKELWKAERKGYSKGESPDVYASAFIWEGDGGPLLVAHGNDYCTAHRIDDGAEVWRVDGLNPTTNGAWRFVSSPLVTPNLIVVPSCKNGPTVGLNPVGAKGKIGPENPAELWRLKFTPDVVSPLLIDDVVYLLGDGPLTAVEAKTGKQIYRQQLPAKQIYRGNMVYADGRIYIVGRDGIGLVVQPGKEFKVLATNDLKEKVYASPAVAGGRLYIRSWDHLYCFGMK
ncbi:MAG: outer rane biosis protein BamB [Gemmataceae bacterium]|nr:outer rane biosis protein BamB [Gemmataceae bacterium]